MKMTGSVLTKKGERFVPGEEKACLKALTKKEIAYLRKKGVLVSTDVEVEEVDEEPTEDPNEEDTEEEDTPGDQQTTPWEKPE